MGNQIDRILKIMGVELMSESVIPPVRSIDQLISFLERSNVGPKIEKWLNELKTAKNSYATSTGQELTQKLLEKVPTKKIVNTLFENNLIERIIPWKSRYSAYDNEIERILNKTHTLEDAQNAIRNSNFFKNIYARIMGENPNSVQVPSIINDKIGEIFNKKILNEFNSYYKKVSGGGVFRLVYKANEPTSIKGARQIIGRYWWTKEQNFEKKIYEIQQEIQYRLKSDGKIDDIVDKLFNAITAFKRSALSDTKKIIDREILNNPNIPEKYKTNFRQQNKIYRQYEPLADEAVRSVLETTFKNFIKRNIEILKLNKTIGWKRLLSTITWQTPQFLSEILTNIVRNGKIATIVERSAAYLVIHNFLIPVLIAAIKTPFKNAELKSAKTEIDKISKLCKDGVLPKEACPTKEEMESIQPLQPKDFWADVISNVPLLQFFIDENGRHKFDDWLFWTWWDEIFNAFFDIWYNKSFSFEEKESLFKSKVKQIQDKVKSELQKNGLDPNNYEKSLKDLEYKWRQEKQDILKKGSEIKQKIDNTRVDTPMVSKSTISQEW